VASVLNVTVQTIASYCESGVFPKAFKLGDSKTSPWRIPQSDLQAYLKKRREQSSRD